MSDEDKGLSCLVSCSCGAIEGSAQLIVDKKLEVRLTWELRGKFYLEKDKLPRCPRCSSIALTRGSWRVAGEVDPK